MRLVEPPSGFGTATRLAVSLLPFLDADEHATSLGYRSVRAVTRQQHDPPHWMMLRLPHRHAARQHQQVTCGAACSAATATREGRACR